MAERGQMMMRDSSLKHTRKRKSINKKSHNKLKKKKQKPSMGFSEKVKLDPRKMKLLRRKARDYDSDNDDDSGGGDRVGEKAEALSGDDGGSEGEEGLVGRDRFGSDNEEDDGDIQPGIMKFGDGSRAFKMAFKSIMKKSVSDDDALGPVLSAHKKLVVEKLAEEEEDKKVKGKARKEKQLVGDQGHEKPDKFLDSHEKFLIGVATKGVVKLFNVVNKAQNAQKGLDPSRSKDEKAVVKKRRKEAFFSELVKTDISAKVNSGEGGGPLWAPLRDNFMLTNSKLKDWDKMPDTSMVAADDIGKISDDSSSEDD